MHKYCTTAQRSPLWSSFMGLLPPCLPSAAQSQKTLPPGFTDGVTETRSSASHCEMRVESPVPWLPGSRATVQCPLQGMGTESSHPSAPPCPEDLPSPGPPGKAPCMMASRGGLQKGAWAAFHVRKHCRALGLEAHRLLCSPSPAWPSSPRFQ